jgi:hypothetical protein
MYFFDNKYLKQYLEMGARLQVFVEGAWWTVADTSDVANAMYGVGYDEHGRPEYFDYRAIEQIKAAGRIFTLDQLQTQKTGQPPEGEEGGKEGEADLPPEDELEKGGADPAGGPPPEEKEEEPAPGVGKVTDSVYRLGDKLLSEAEKRREGKPLSPGKFVRNVDAGCEFKGSFGPVIRITPDLKEGYLVTFKAYNSGPSFRMGEEIIKPIRCLQEVK